MKINEHQNLAIEPGDEHIFEYDLASLAKHNLIFKNNDYPLKEEEELHLKWRCG